MHRFLCIVLLVFVAVALGEDEVDNEVSRPEVNEGKNFIEACMKLIGC